MVTLSGEANIIHTIHDKPPLNVDAVIKAITTIQQETDKQSIYQEKGEVRINTESPVLLVVMSDLHIGNQATNHLELMKDLKRIQCTTNAFLSLNGDIADNLHVFRKGGAEEVLSAEMQGLLILELLSELDKAGKIVSIATGNHDFFVDNFYRSFGKVNAPMYYNWGDTDITVGKTQYRLAQFHEFTMGNSTMSHLLRELKVLEIRYPDADIVAGAHCFDDKTEILTPDGWKKYTEIEKGDMVMTYNKKKDQLEWNDINEKFVYKDFKELIHIDSNIASLAVTDKHGLVVGKVTNNKGKERIHWHYEDAKKVMDDKARRYFKMGSNYNQTLIELPTCWIRLMAWILAEGNILLRGEKIHTIRLAQSDLPKKGGTLELEKILGECGISYKKTKKYEANTTKHGTHRNYDAYTYSLHDSSGVYKKLESYMGKRKEMKSSLLGMNEEQSKAFIDSFIFTDGCKNSSAKYSYQISAKRMPHIDMLQAIACKCGYRSTISTNNKTGMNYITLNSRGMGIVYKYSWSKKPYKGNVWCVSVDNGTLMVRRNGKTVITQNTHRKAVEEVNINGKRRVLIETGSYKPKDAFQVGHGNARYGQFDYCGASILLFPDTKRMIPFYDLETGIEAVTGKLFLKQALIGVTSNLLKNGR